MASNDQPAYHFTALDGATPELDARQAAARRDLFDRLAALPAREVSALHDEDEFAMHMANIAPGAI